ncbi:hypothetical protein ACHAPJ_009750 [Fusarium lateritium]
MVFNKVLSYEAIPGGLPVVGQDLMIKTLPDFDEDQEPPDGGFTSKIVTVSFDPYLRRRMDPSAAKDFPPFAIGSPIMNTGICKIIKSGSPEWKPGDLALGFLPVQEYVSIPKTQAKTFRHLDNPQGIDSRHFLGSLGGPGRTAYASLFEIGKPKAGETIFVAAATGAVGQVVAAVAMKHGLHVIGSTGGIEKYKILKDKMKVQAAINYRESNLKEELGKLAPKGIDIYYDTVGGEHLEAALDLMNLNGRIIACGFSSQYGVAPEHRYGVRNTGNVIGRQLTWRGFNMADRQFGSQFYQDHLNNVQAWIVDGSFEPVMDVTKGIDNAANGLIRLFAGENVGKAVLDL